MWRSLLLCAEYKFSLMVVADSADRTEVCGFVIIQREVSSPALLAPSPLMSDGSSSTSYLTPQSTGTQDSSPPSSSNKSRPQAAFYPNVNAANKEQKPFSRSAAKRESVMALGSIEHLQHYFTKTGLIVKKEYVTLFLSRGCPT